MTIDEIRKNTPDAATHYECDCVVDYIVDYWSVDNKTWYWWHDDKWKLYPFGNPDANDLKPLH